MSRSGRRRIPVAPVATTTMRSVRCAMCRVLLYLRPSESAVTVLGEHYARSHPPA